jgi:3-phenylpropionate/trans-cinnamate dioxygenase ferredoxin reductase subunit
MTGLAIVGGSYAALNVAASARQHGYAESITILTDEHELPYHRPPLSKGFLLGATDRETLPLRGEAFYRDNVINIVFGARASAVDCGASRIETTKGAFAFSKLAITTGTRARIIPIPGGDLRGVFTLRSLADADAIRAVLPGVRSVVVVGGGFIGLEMAASMAQSGVEVTVLEGLGRVLARVTGGTISGFIEREFAGHGVNLACGTAVEAFEGQNGAVRCVRTRSGQRYAADMVILAVGAEPNVELAEDLGLATAQGVVVDLCGRTANPAVFAAGDCAFGMNAFAGRSLRLESVQNATDQGKAAGAAIAGIDLPNSAVPWFWSDQFDLKLQMVGLCNGSDREVIRGSMDARKFSIFYLKRDRIVAIDSVNNASDNMLGRKLLGRPHSVSAEQVSDPDFNMRSLI